jgi:hypothetical protein
MTMMHVFWDGRVPRCPGDTEGDEGVGNAWEESLQALWGRLGTYREKHLAHRFEELPDRCQECRDWMTGAALRLRPSPTCGEEDGLPGVRGDRGGMADKACQGDSPHNFGGCR